MSKSILVVDDDNLVRKTLAESLTAAGYTVTEAVNGQDGLTKIQQLRPDLVVSDVRMPELDGLQMVQKLRAEEWGKQVPIIILSTDDNTASINQALSSGVTVYLSKTTLSPDEITEQIKQAL